MIISFVNVSLKSKFIFLLSNKSLIHSLYISIYYIVIFESIISFLLFMFSKISFIVNGIKPSLLLDISPCMV